jgi:hypothetical protein
MMGMAEMKKGGSTDMAQDKAMMKKAMKQHDERRRRHGRRVAVAPAPA